MEQSTPNSKELKNIKKATKKADPTKYSPLGKSVDLGGPKIGYGYYGFPNTDINTNDVFYKIYENPETQMFVSLLSKGILHVSDVVEIDQGSFFSKEIPLNKIEPGKTGEKEAEFFLLRWIFSDLDKSDNMVAKNNVNSDKGNRFAHYDYGKAFGYRHFKNPSLDYYDELDYYVDREGNIEKYNIVKNLIAEKNSLFKERLEDVSFFDVLIKKSGIDLTKLIFLKGETLEEKTENFRRFLLERTTLLDKMILLDNK